MSLSWGATRDFGRRSPLSLSAIMTPSKPCPRCKVIHEPDWFKNYYTEWFFAYTKLGLSASAAAEKALRQVQKHTPDAPTPMPFWVRLGLKFGGKDMDILKKLWNFLDGKKTAIGAILTFLVMLGPQIVQLAKEIGVTQDGLAYVTSAIAIIGAVHKIWKKFFGTNGK